MSSADPTDVGSPPPTSRDVLHIDKSSDLRSRNTSKQVLRDDADLRAERPQPRPDTGKTKPDEPKKDSASDSTEAQGPKGIKGAFQKHPIAMIVCLGLIVAGFIAGIAWYLHARHYESTDDAFIDGRPVLVSPQVTGSITRVNVTDNQIVKAGDLLATIDTRNYKAAVDQADAQIRQDEATMKN